MTANDDAVRSAATSFLQAPSTHEHLICIELDAEGGHTQVDPTVLLVSDDAPCFTVTTVVVKLESCASVSIESKDGKIGIMVLLGAGEGWAVVSVVISPTLDQTIDPSSFAAITGACWDGYCKANRTLDGDKMAQVFHPLCRLMFIGGEKSIVSFSQEQFCSMVTNRYTLDLHKKYAHLQNDPRASAGDTMLGAIFTNPQLACVTLKVGHPPCLWTDLFTMARLADDKWWIVHKSSTHEKLLADEARE